MATKKNIQIGGVFKPVTADKKVIITDNVFDDTLEKFQDVINTDVKSKLDNHESRIVSGIETASQSASASRSSAEAAQASAEQAAQAASRSAASAAETQEYAGVITGTLEEIAGSDDMPEATIAQVALNTGKLSELASKTAEIAPNTNDADLEINDEQNNTLVRFRNGGVKTKYFDSETTPSLADVSGADLYIADSNGKVLMQISGGHIKTKNFDSRNITPSGGVESWLKGKVVAVIGDSISTKFNKNAVEIKIETEDVGVQLSAYLTKYDVDGGLSLGGHTFTSAEIGNEVTFVPTIADVGKTIGKAANKNDASIKTWWEHLEDSTGCSVIPVSWSGASITSHESTKESFKTSYAWHPSQIRKCGIRTSGTMERTAPDVVIIYRGTNDMTHTSYTRLTNEYFDGGNFAYPTTDVVGGNYGYKEGLVLTIAKVREAYPNAIILLCTLNYFKRINYSAYPTNNGINTLSQYNNAIREVADYMGCGIIEFDKDGVTYENCETYAPDRTHPNNDGHLLMGNKAIADINKFNS